MNKCENDSMELRIREVAQQLFFEQGYAATSPTVNPKSSAWSKRSSNHRNNLPNMQKWYIFERFVFVYLQKM